MERNKNHLKRNMNLPCQRSVNHLRLYSTQEMGILKIVTVKPWSSCLLLGVLFIFAFVASLSHAEIQFHESVVHTNLISHSLSIISFLTKDLYLCFNEYRLKPSQWRKICLSKKKKKKETQHRFSINCCLKPRSSSGEEWLS